MLYPPSRSTRRPSTRRRNERPRPRRRPPGTAPPSPNSKPRTSAKTFHIDASGINRGFADAGKKISASVDAKTLTTNLDAGMKQLGKNLAVDVDAEISFLGDDAAVLASPAVVSTSNAGDVRSIQRTRH